MDLELEIQTTNVGITTSILEIPRVPIFRQNGYFLQKLILGSKFQKFKSGLGISTNFQSKQTTFNFLAEIAQLHAIFSSNNVEGVAENWVEVEVSWMELDGAGW